jgi:putative spermidine/putrescine transport system permease protein
MGEVNLVWPVRLSAWILVGFIFLPFLVVIPVSFSDRPYLSLPQHALSLEHYRELLGDEGWLHAMGKSTLIASFSTVAAVLLGSLCALGVWRMEPGRARWVQSIMLLPLIIPTIVLGLAFYRTWVDLRIVNSAFGVVLAHAITSLPYVFITVSAALAHVDPRLEMAALSLGASMRQVLSWVLVPVVMPGILSGALFAFVHSFDELIIVLFITSRGLETLPKKMWMSLEDDLTPVIACVAVFLSVLTLALLLSELALRSRLKATTTS